MDKMGRYARMYLNDVMAKLPYIVQPIQQTNYDDLLQLLPHNWKLTHEEAIFCCHEEISCIAFMEQYMQNYRLTNGNLQV